MDELARRLAALKTLTPRELEVLKLLCSGMTQREIRERLVLSLSTVKFHLGNAYDKLDVAELQTGPRQREVGRYCDTLRLLEEEAPASSLPVTVPEPEPHPLEPSRWALAAIEEDDKELEKQRRDEERRRRALVPSTPAAAQAWQPEPPIPPMQQPRRMHPLLIIGPLAMIAVLLVAILAILVAGRGNEQPTVVQQIVTVTVTAAAQPTLVVTPSPIATMSATAPPTASPTATVRSTATPTAPPVAAGTVLYEANASTGFPGWPSGFGWKVLNNEYLNDGTSNQNLRFASAPYVPGDHGIADYAVEVDLQVLGRQYDRLGVVVRSKYFIAFYWYFTTVNIYYEGGFDVGSKVFRFDPLDRRYVIRVEVRGNAFRVLVDGITVLQGNDSRTLDGGQVGLFSENTQLSVRSFKVIKL